MEKHHIHHRDSIPYHPQANGQVEIRNREIENILAKVANMSKRDWVDRITVGAWTHNITWKRSTRFTLMS